MNIVFEIQGGIGKNVVATVIVELLRKKYPKDTLIVVTDAKDVFVNNPHIDDLFSFEERLDALDKYVHHQLDNCIIFVKNVYQESDFITGKGNIYEVWAKMYDLEYNGEKPKLYLSDEEELKFGDSLKENNGEFFHLTDGNYIGGLTMPKENTNMVGKKPILLIHPHGGALQKSEDVQLISHYVKPLNYNWSRDLPINLTKRIIKEYKDTYDIFYIKHPSQPQTFQGATPADGSIRDIILLLLKSDKRILIDSFAQHLAAALDLPSTVCWVTTNPKSFGYDIHNNIIAKRPEFITDMSCYNGYNLVEPLHNIPYSSTANIFNLNQIIK